MWRGMTKAGAYKCSTLHLHLRSSSSGLHVEKSVVYVDCKIENFQLAKSWWSEYAHAIFAMYTYVEKTELGSNYFFCFTTSLYRTAYCNPTHTEMCYPMNPKSWKAGNICFKVICSVSIFKYTFCIFYIASMCSHLVLLLYMRQYIHKKATLPSGSRQYSNFILPLQKQFLSYIAMPLQRRWFFPELQVASYYVITPNAIWKIF